MSGLPAVGKSELANALGRHLGAAVLSVDPIEAAMWRCGIEPSLQTGVAAYEVAATLAGHQLELGLDVIGDAVNSLEVAREMWRRAAREAGASWRVIHIICSDLDAHRSRLAARQRNIPAFPEPSWEDVELRAREFEPWPEPALVVDAADDFATNLKQAVGFITEA